MLKLRRVEPDQSLREVEFDISTFPDQTTQVWKVKLDKPKGAQRFQILWLFESENEFFQMLQLTVLLQSEFQGIVALHVPYLPYARQDKEIENTTTWALHLFAALLKTSGLSEVITFDQHSSHYFTSQSAEAFHASVPNHDVICFPDEGARKRYPHLHKHPHVYFNKVRNPSTGEIEKHELVLNNQDLSGKSILIVDDLCDGGATFTGAAIELKKHGPGVIDLCVSHGLFSKGREALHSNGINQIYTTNSLLRNPEGFSVWK